MTIQMLRTWNGLEQYSIQAPGAVEEARLISAGLARDFRPPMDGSKTVLVDDDGIPAPSTGINAAVGTAGALTGAYSYTQTFVTALGETAPWPGTATVVNPSSQRVNLTAIAPGPPGVIARRIYRTAATPQDPRNYQFLVEIPDNNTTTYTDNALDGTLGAPVDWNASNRGQFRLSSGDRFSQFSDQSTALGQGTFATNTGYASVAIGFEALRDNTSGRRNVGVGVYALERVTTGYENTALGVHAGGGCTVSVGNTLIGYRVGGTTNDMLNFNTAVGSSAFTGSGSKGTSNTAVGYEALGTINSADGCIGIGRGAGKYANASRQVFIDSADRTNIANCQDIGLIYGKAEATAQIQDLRLNAITRIGPGAAATAIVANLQAASAALRGYRGWVTDATVAYVSANVGSTVAGGGSNAVPVFCNGTNWVIG
jgi:hypothetical protein